MTIKQKKCNLTLTDNYLSVFNENINNKIYYNKLEYIKIKENFIAIKTKDIKQFLLNKNNETIEIYNKTNKLI